MAGTKGTALHVSVSATAEEAVEGRLLLAREIELTKAAILYGDRARLVSPAASFVYHLVQNVLSARSEQDKLYGLSLVLPAMQNSLGALPPEYPELVRLVAILGKPEAERTPGERKFVRNSRAGIRRAMQTWDSILENSKALEDASGVRELIAAANAGILDVHIFRGVLDTDEERRSKAKEFREQLTTSLGDPATLPLFDDETAQIVAVGLEFGRIRVTKGLSRRSSEIALAADLFERLPSFPRASVKDILDIRTDLAAPLTRFRAEMIALSEGIQAAPWEPEFVSETSRVFRQNVEPAVLEIEDQVRSNTYLAELLENPIEHAAKAASGFPAGYGLGAAIGSLASLEELMTLLVGATTAALVAAHLRKKKKDAAEKAEQHSLFLYYKVMRSLDAVGR